MTISQNKFEELLKLIGKLNHEVEKIKNKDIEVSIKSDDTPITQADLYVNNALNDFIKTTEYQNVISEENKQIDFSERSKWQWFWIIDPIDGTTNFLHGVPHFAISIALKTNNEIVSGLIYDPIKDEIFFAEKDNGAYFNNHRIRVSKRNDLNECLFITGEKIKNEPDIPLRKSGCAALDLAYIASGRYDGYFQDGLNLWDIAAGIILIKEAGGIINDINLNKNENVKVIASNSNINAKFKEKLVNF